MLRRHDRQQSIINKLRAEGTLSIAGLAQEYGVSDETIRRELKVLEEEGTVVRLHGGVRLAPQRLEGPLEMRKQQNAEAKIRIAAAAATFVANGDIIFIDAGTTSCYVAQALARHHALTVVTNSLEVATQLGGINGNKLFLAGGQMDYDYLAFSDSYARDYVGGFTPHLAILSVGAISLDQGLMDFHPGEAAISKIAYATAQRVLLGVDASKFGRYGLVRTAALKEVDILVTDEAVDGAYRQAFEAAQIVVA